jgi:hypothetical protein
VPSEILCRAKGKPIFRVSRESEYSDILSKVFSVVPLSKLGALKGQEGGPYLEAALAILKPLAEADRLDANRKSWIPKIEQALAQLKGTSPYMHMRTQTQIRAAFEAGDFSKAAALQAELAAAIEKAETERDGKPAAATVAELIGLSWYKLFAGEHQAALAAADRAIGLAPDNIVPSTNRAHALMFLGRAEESRAAYAAHRGKDVANQGKWEAVIVRNFAELRARGLTSPQMGEIEAMMKAASGTVATP